MEKPIRIRIAGGSLVVGQSVQTGDILIEGEKIAAIGDLRDTRADITMGADWCAYEGLSVIGRIEKVLVRGELIIDGDRCLAEKGRGRYQHRALPETCI